MSYHSQNGEWRTDKWCVKCCNIFRALFLNIAHMLICVNLLRMENEKNDFKCLLCIYWEWRIGFRKYDIIWEWRLEQCDLTMLMQCFENGERDNMIKHNLLNILRLANGNMRANVKIKNREWDLENKTIKKKYHALSENGE